MCSSKPIYVEYILFEIDLKITSKFSSNGTCQCENITMKIGRTSIRLVVAEEIGLEAIMDTQ